MSEICRFYEGKKIFLTGGSGFLGKVLIEKLLSSTNISTIYMLIRSKKGKSIETRIDEIFDSILFEKVTNLKKKVFPINGDCSMHNLGLTLEDRRQLVENVNIVFHAAATTRFNENFKISFDINVKATKAVLTLCKQMKQLESVVYVSTAYVHCYRDTIDEIFYGIPFKYEEIEEKLKNSSPDQIEELTSKLNGKWPNNYTFTKALAEAVIENDDGNLPIAILRPSIVVSTYNEPLRGWIDNNFTGVAGLLAAIYTGFIRVLHIDIDRIADIVPVDGCMGATIATAWDIYKKNVDNVPIYNYVSSPERPITWKEFIDAYTVYNSKYPTNLHIWTPCALITSKNYFTVLILKIFVSILPAIIMDTAAMLLGRKPKIINIYKKLAGLDNAFCYFCLREWKFYNGNMVRLWKDMNDTDKGLFSFSVSLINWNDYFENLVRGFRIYLLKDPLNTLNSTKRKLKWFAFIRTLLFLIFIITLAFCFILEMR